MDDRPAPTDAGWVVAANASAGSVDEVLGQVLAPLAADAPTRVRWMEEPGDVVDIARAHPEERLVVVGGDGTISAAIDQLISADLGDRPVGVLPGGTGNDFVRGLGLPVDAAEAAAQLADCRPRRLSALRVDDRWGVNTCHVGLGAAAARTASGLKARLGPAAYPVGATVSGLRRPAWDARVTADGDCLADGELLMAAVVLGRTIGGGTDLAPEPSLTEPEADLLLSTGASPSDRVRLGAALLRDDPGRGGGATRSPARRVRIECATGIPVNLDGEDLGDRRDLSVEVVPEAWTVLAPS
ncbi:diacylglycerol kinase family protein [Iamia majanohamensis]|uniref:Diacylglycerol kinase family protein n=1 Tax=Iamia majanohamensis TaxID=467976 RepID=A0AAE9YHX8_9ACTN|nr:diacylglycerol kinase family protein [Iamia majanohamensis]WCO68096.1 diacylglycerol kinase family protein [Iamia majanohamensis]